MNKSAASLKSLLLDALLAINFLFYYSPSGIAYRKMQSVSTLLDVGCGTGTPMKYFRRKRSFYCVGFDVFPSCVKACKANKLHDDYVLGDARSLPFKEKSFGTVMCLAVVEHIFKPQALNLISQLERIAYSSVIISTEVGFNPRHQRDGNPFQLHRSGFLPSEFKSRGYVVRGHGLSAIRGVATRLESLLPQPFGCALSIFWSAVFAWPLAYWKPERAYSMLAYKKF